ncbi:hypothetical protein scyTo_0025700 [Scyliorhinus torazame]|uniref:Uncharacterized protein n=1 Tax=Scyliorhinus torazame TaxID=75743 RepID=A0A401QI66_SCYTO|nr:hypothetical protein [Scyliorhinus torazame]
MELDTVLEVSLIELDTVLEVSLIELDTVLEVSLIELDTVLEGGLIDLDTVLEVGLIDLDTVLEVGLIDLDTVPEVGLIELDIVLEGGLIELDTVLEVGLIELDTVLEDGVGHLQLQVLKEAFVRHWEKKELSEHLREQSPAIEGLINLQQRQLSEVRKVTRQLEEQSLNDLVHTFWSLHDDFQRHHCHSNLAAMLLGPDPREKDNEQIGKGSGFGDGVQDEVDGDDQEEGDWDGNRRRL